MNQSLKSLLQYHQTLVSPEFVANVLSRLTQIQHRRSIILSLFTTCGLVFAAVGLFSFASDLRAHLPSYFDFNPLMFSLLVMGLIAIFWDGFVDWFTN